MSADDLREQQAAFEHALARMARPERAPEDEQACVRLLAEMFPSLCLLLEWQTIARRVAELRAAAPREPRHRARLDAYEGYAAVRTGAYEAAEALLSAALAAAEAEPDARLVALNGMAQAHWFRTRYEAALDWFRRLHAEARAGGQRTYEGVALVNMGIIYNDLGQPERALELTVESLAIYRETGDRRREAYALYEIGNNALLLGRWDTARDHLTQAIALHEELGIVSALAALHWAAGYLAHLQGDEAAAEATYRHALAVAERPDQGDRSVALDIYTNLGLLALSQGRLDDADALYGRAAALARELGRAHWLALVRYRSGAIAERRGLPEAALEHYRAAIEGLESLRGDSEAEEIKLGLLGSAEQVYESAVLLLLAAGRHAEAFSYAERARSRAFLDVLARRDPELTARFDAPVAALEEVQAALPEGALLLEYFTAGVLPRGERLVSRIPESNARLREQLSLPPQTWVFAVTRAGLEAHPVALDPNTLRPQPGDPGPGRRLLRERLLVSLHERLLGPVDHLLAGRELLYLVPHGPLHYVPFMALRSAAGRHLLSADGPALALAPSATVLVRNCLARPPRPAGSSLALGYNDAGDADGQGALRYAEAEAGHVARLTGGAAWAGDAPKSARLLAEAAGLRRLHIAGHAVYNPHDPLGSALRIGPADTLTARDIIGGLRLEAELVTLSACTSGLSHVVPGDELLGLQRAFLLAGARTVVCTLWEAADLVALLVMDRFYRSAAQGAPPAAALRDAQVHVREMTGADLARTLERWRAEDPAFAAALGALPVVAPEHAETRLYADPLYWAPFMLIGRAA